MRVNRLALGVVVVVSLWSQHARAAASVITMAPNPLDVGNVLVGSMAMATGTLSDTKPDAVDLVVTSTCTGAGAGAFTLNPLTGIDLSSPQMITVTYAPTVRGASNCRVDVYKAGTSSVIGSFRVKGTGQSPPTISVSGNTSFPTVRFNDAAPGHTTTRTYSVTNKGDIDLLVTDVQIGGTNAADFPITSGGTTATIPHNATVDWIVTFDPSAAGNRTATLTFTSNDPVTPSTILNLGGAGSTAIINVNDRAFGIVNVGSSSSLDITISNTGIAPKGKLGVTSAAIAGGSWFTFSACGGGVDCTFLPPLSIATTTVVGVKCTPPVNATVNDMQAATVTFTSDTDDALATPDTVSNLTCTVGKSALATSSPSVLFPNQLFGTTSAVQTLTATNTGNVSASFYFQTTGAGASEFTVTAQGGCGTSASNKCVLAPAAVVMFDVTFQPSAEADIVAGLDLVSTVLPYPQLSLSGRGIDRHIMTPLSVMFADTFRNPGTRATVMPVTVQNIGEYPLHVSALAVSGDPTWSLADPPDGFDVPGLGSHDVMVTFTPGAVGKAPSGVLTVTSDDRVTATSSIALTGNGKDRRVQMGPDAIDLGDTGAGVPTRLGEIRPDGLLAITNMDGDNAFHIREIVIEGDDVFAIQDLSANADLPAGATKKYDIVFSPPRIGEFEATAILYLDEDPTPQMSIELHGRALFVDAHGGGGCSTGRGMGAAMVGILGALLLGRRRRRSAAALLGAGLVLLPGAVRADPTRNIQLTVFDPAPSTSRSSLQLQSADVGASGDFVAMAIASYASNPLVLGTVQNDDPVVRARTGLSIGGAYAFGHGLEAGLRMPFFTQSGETVPVGTFGVPPASGTARGDLTVHVKARAFRSSRLTLGLGLAVTLPTATDSQFAGSDKASLRSLALVTIAASPNLTLHINAGGVFRTKATFANIEQRSGAAGGVGASLRISAPFSVSLEAFGEVIPSGYHAEPAPGDTMGATSNLTTIEALAAARYQVARTFAITVGGGRGVTSGIGAPDLRGVVMIAYVPTAHGPARHQVIATEPPIDPSVADRDHDRIPDAVDKCPDDPEDRDGFEDTDGCPDPDNDKDGVPDEADKCPLEPEDRDGFEDSDGCPDPDNDKDGIPDATDKCPNEPEKINGVDDNDGCPDAGEPLVMSTPDRLELVQSVVFTGSTISPSSANALGQLAATLRARTDIVRLRITAHVQPSKSRDNDQALSEQRAAAVRDWLLNWGIANSRLEIRGLGGTKPLVRPTTKGAAQVNERIELLIIERN